MKIKLLKPTMVDGKQRQAGWSGDIGISDAKTLIGMGKAISMEEKTTSVNLKVDVSKNECNEYISTLLEDIQTLTLKELKAKYPAQESEE